MIWMYEFRKGHSTYMVADNIVYNLDHIDSTVNLFTDLSKAFDTIDQSILSIKLDMV